MPPKRVFAALIPEGYLPRADKIYSITFPFMDTLALSEETCVTVNEKNIHWKQLWSLAALYASVIIGWIAYQNYQPRLLVQFGFMDYTFVLTAAQAVILVITPLIAGRIGDRYRAQKGHRLPIISSGISFAAMVFMSVAFTLLGNPGEFFKWILPVLIVLWLISMSVFTSPALSTMELFTPADKLPRAMAVLTITGNLVYALEPVIVDVIDYVGAPLTFILGGVLVFASGYALQKNALGLFRHTGEKEKTSASYPGESPYAFIFFLGLSVGLASTVLFYFLPPIFGERSDMLFSSNLTFLVVGILLFSALISWPVSSVINRYGIKRSFWIGFCLFLAATGGIYAVTSSTLLLIFLLIFAVSFTTMSVASLPLAIKRAANSEKVFCVGIFFSGIALPEGLWEVFFQMR